MANPIAPVTPPVVSAPVPATPPVVQSSTAPAPSVIPTIPNAEAELAQQSLDALKQKATLLGMKFHPSIGEVNLREKLNEFVADQEAAAPATLNPTPVAVTDNTSGTTDGAPSEVANAKKSALALVRCNITCMNPMKSNHTAEIITSGNSLTGTIRKTIPFKIDTHVEAIILNALREKTFQTWTEKKDRDGKKIKVSSQVQEYAIHVLPPLTQEELDALALRQAAANGTAVA